MKREHLVWVSVAVAVVVLAAAAWIWRQRHQTGDAATQTVSAPVPSAAAPAPAEPQYQLEGAAANGAADPAAAVTELYGKQTVQSLFRLDDLSRRIVATVDNLGRARAPANLWPVNPVPGRFQVDGPGDSGTVGVANAKRYAAYVSLLDKVDLARAVVLYRQVYPTLQKAYEDIGYPQGYFNDRLVAVIDLLLATPEPAGAPALHMPSLDASVQPTRPWVLYEFDDPALQSLSSGQKVLLRLSAADRQRVRSRLTELRARVTAKAG
jgi:hypothetical protein